MQTVIGYADRGDSYSDLISCNMNGISYGYR